MSINFGMTSNVKALKVIDYGNRVKPGNDHAVHERFVHRKDAKSAERKAMENRSLLSIGI